MTRYLWGVDLHLDPNAGWWATGVAVAGALGTAFLGAFRSGQKYQHIMDRLDALDGKIDDALVPVRQAVQAAATDAARANGRLDTLTGTGHV